MDVSYVNPFVEAVDSLFHTMLGEEVRRGQLSLVKEAAAVCDITAIIGMSGPARGAIALSFPLKTAMAIVGRILGQEIRVMNTDVMDAVGEIVNIVAGSAKAKLIGGDTPIELGLPSTVRGQDVKVDLPDGTRWLEIPFTSELGPFAMRVAFEPNVEASPAPRSEQGDPRVA